ncbi:MAG: glycosyl hydrolase, partial [Bacteroidota bacterium]|nr:glycosyl hydrolase [Bacteroidota bacterium]
MSNYIAILKKHLLFSLILLFIISISFSVTAQNILTSGDQSMQEFYESAARIMALREIGPAAMGGRISDIKVDPNDLSTWYLAVGSGGVWKTVNSGTTWEAIFDDQISYSIGTIEIDPNNSKVIWVGTGENVSGRHVAWGDGVYKSEDAGKSWKKMGLDGSDHIGRILIDPRDSDVVLVAAEGPLWSSGGLRGVFRTTDGGENWVQVLDIDEKTGATDLEFDPSNPEVVYAASYERRRKTWAFLAGGPGSGIHKSTNNGRTWTELRSGLPEADMGKIGLAVSPADPNLVYATIESDLANKGFYRSTDKGESWEKRNSYTSGGTGPHYYQEIEASPTNADVVIQMDVFYQVTRDGGATFNYLET